MLYSCLRAHHDTNSSSFPARVRTLMNGTLSADGRAIDEDLAAQFMEVFGKYISEPRLMQL